MGRGHASLHNAQSLLIGLMNTHEDQTLGENGKTARQNIEGKTKFSEMKLAPHFGSQKISTFSVTDRFH